MAGRSLDLSVADHATARWGHPTGPKFDCAPGADLHGGPGQEKARPDRLPRGKRAIGARKTELNHTASTAQRVQPSQISDRRATPRKVYIGQLTVGHMPGT
ncbi:hypothetical protein GCM10027186_17410 [Micromonospora schwarzwaldensis]